jgi:hypothetical protein
LPACIITGQLIPESALGQSTLGKEYEQQRIEKYLELGEKGFIKDCKKNQFFPGSVCDDIANFTKMQIEELEQNQTSDSVIEPITYKTHNDYENGFSVEYPSDWHVGEYGYKIFEGTREFSITVNDDPRFSLLDTYNLGDIMFEVDKERDGVKIIDNPGRVNIDGEPAFTYSYTEDSNEIMTMALMHDSVAYTFKYETLKQNFDKDFDTMMHFFGTISFQE